MEHLDDAKTPANQVISLPPEAFWWTPITVGYAAAHPRLQALGFQPSALLPPEAAADYLKNTDFHKVFSHIPTSCANPCQKSCENPHLPCFIWRNALICCKSAENIAFVRFSKVFLPAFVRFSNAFWAAFVRFSNFEAKILAHLWRWRGFGERRRGLSAVWLC